MKKNIVILIMALSIIYAGAAMCEAANIINSGISDDDGNVTWTFDDEGTMTYSGVGYANIAWYPTIDGQDVKKVIFEEGITDIGFAAMNMTAITSVVVPKSVEAIHVGAFSTESLKTVYLLNPKVFIWENGFRGECLTDIYYAGSEDDWKENINLNSFGYEGLNATIHYNYTGDGSEQSDVDSNISVNINGMPLSFDVVPRIINDRTMVPMRAIFEALGAEVSWDGELQTITAVRENDTIRLTINEPRIYVNKALKELDTAPIIIDDRTLVPVRAVSEALGCTVDWDGETRTVAITE